MKDRILILYAKKEAKLSARDEDEAEEGKEDADFR